MGRKVNPIGFRLSVRRDWKSRWYAKGKQFSEMVIKDVRARRFIEKQYATALVSRIEIGRKMNNVTVTIHSARPGVIIGKKGEGIDRLRIQLRKIFDVNGVAVVMQDVKQPETDARLIALNIANQLENRVMFRRAMRRALTNAMRLKVEGIKIMSAGRLNGIEIARTEWYREGRVPLHTLKNDIDYGFAEANTAMGVVGVKVWVSHGDKYGRHKKVKYTAQGDAAEASEAEGDEAAAAGAVAEADVTEVEATEEAAIAEEAAIEEEAASEETDMEEEPVDSVTEEQEEEDDATTV